MADVPPGSESLFNWVLTGLLSMLATAASIVAGFYKKIEGANATAIQELKTRLDKAEVHIDACEKDRVQLAITCAGHASKIEILEEQLTRAGLNP